MANHNSLIEKRRFVKGKLIIGIDPANDKRKVQIVYNYGIPLGRSFSFPNTYKGDHTILWKRVRRYLTDEVYWKPALIFAVKTTCDF
ncbi:MAG: hypothetical protein ACE5EE_00155 [Fidelibacterota bacterium]